MGFIPIIDNMLGVQNIPVFQGGANEFDSSLLAVV